MQQVRSEVGHTGIINCFEHPIKISKLSKDVNIEAANLLQFYTKINEKKCKMRRKNGEEVHNLQSAGKPEDKHALNYKEIRRNSMNIQRFISST